MTIKNKPCYLKGWRPGHFSLTASVSLMSLSLCCSLVSPLLRILVLPQSRRHCRRCLCSLVPVISGGAITREMTVPPRPDSPPLRAGVPLHFLIPFLCFPPAAALYAPLSRLRRAHHGDGVCSACTHTRYRTSQAGNIVA